MNLAHGYVNLKGRGHGCNKQGCGHPVYEGQDQYRGFRGQLVLTLFLCFCGVWARVFVFWLSTFETGLNSTVKWEFRVYFVFSLLCVLSWVSMEICFLSYKKVEEQFKYFVCAFLFLFYFFPLIFEANFCHWNVNI